MGIEVLYVDSLEDNFSVDRVVKNTIRKFERRIIENYLVETMLVESHDGKTTIFIDDDGRKWFSRYGKFIVCEETPDGKDPGHLMCMEMECSCKNLIFYEDEGPIRHKVE
jgi:hypothetical protein